MARLFRLEQVRGKALISQMDNEIGHVFTTQQIRIPVGSTEDPSQDQSQRFLASVFRPVGW
jgi:hypothetical protein